MVNNFNYINIREVLSRLLKHPLLQSLDLEQVVYHTIDFLSFFGLPELYRTEEEKIHIEEYRGLLPCNCISINQVKNDKDGVCLRAMTDTFLPDKNEIKGDASFKTQGRVIFTSFKDGDILVSYKAVPIDEEGFPLLIDNPTFLKALESYIKKEVFTVLFDMSKISGQVLANTQAEYGFRAGQLQSEFSIPSVSEMESLKNQWCSLIQRTTEFRNGFKNLGTQEYIKLH